MMCVIFCSFPFLDFFLLHSLNLSSGGISLLCLIYHIFYFKTFFQLKDQTALNAFNVSSSTRFTCPAISIIDPKGPQQSKLQQSKTQSGNEDNSSTHQQERNVIAGVAPRELWIWTRQELEDASVSDSHVEKRVKTVCLKRKKY